MDDLLRFERLYLECGCKYICGVDEVGRGPLAGPVTVTAIIMDLENLVEGVKDSKQVAEKKREILYGKILERAVAVNTVCIENGEIDQINILNATKKAMKQAVLGLSIKPDIVLSDAVVLDLPCRCHAIIKGDALSYSIAAASIVAKVYRDRLMREYDNIYPEYGFAGNKGYGSAQHIAVIKEIGPSPLHRRTFIKNFAAADTDDE